MKHCYQPVSGTSRAVLPHAHNEAFHKHPVAPCQGESFWELRGRP